MMRSLTHHLSTISVHKRLIPLLLITLPSMSHADTNNSLVPLF